MTDLESFSLARCDTLAVRTRRISRTKLFESVIIVLVHVTTVNKKLEHDHKHRMHTVAFKRHEHSTQEIFPFQKELSKTSLSQSHK